MIVMRPELEPLPRRMQRLPLDGRGYPVPFFVTWINGVPEFRATDPRRWSRAIAERLCWVCGDRRGKYQTFVLGPMCTITRTTSEPPCHHDCATWAARNCPFLVRPHMIRREDAFTASCTSAGEPLFRNPGVVALWTTTTLRLFDDGRGRKLIEVGDPVHVEWFAEGRAATRGEILASIDSGYPSLVDMCDREANDDRRTEARAALERQRSEAIGLLPEA